MNLVNRVAIVTGAGGGLGRAHALFLASQGARIVVNDVSADTAHAVAESINASGGKAVAIGASVTDEAAIGAMAQAVLDRWGRIDILVNNAGILRDKSFGKLTVDDFRAVIDVHLIGAFICTQAVWGAMRERQFGRIVMTTSASGLFGNFGQANYGTAKMALVGLMQTLAIEGEKHGIRVNCLAPTAATAMTKGVVPDDILTMFAPELISPGLLALVEDDAPTRAILCCGAGHFAAANITLTQGVQIGSGPEAASTIARRWSEISDRDGDIVPTNAFEQVRRDLAAAAGTR